MIVSLAFLIIFKMEKIMKRKILFIIYMFSFALFSVNAFANVFPINSVGTASECTPNPVVHSATESDFCIVFPQSVASCWPPIGSHKNFTPQQMTSNYDLMKRVYGSILAACKANASKNGSSAQACYDQWTCYISGGSDPNGSGLCSGTGSSCL